MLSVRARCIAGLLLAALLVPVLVAPLRAPAAGAPSTVPGAPVRPVLGPDDDSSAYSVTVNVDPGTWTMSPGDSVNLTAWIGEVPFGCTVLFTWFTWYLAGPASYDAFLNGSTGTSERLTADAGATGELMVTVVGTAGLDCPTYQVTVSSEATSGVRLLPGLYVRAVEVTPDPATPGTLVAVGWDVVGGVGPYAVTVTFGDGNSTTLTQSAPGDGLVYHRFVAGEFAPQVAVADSDGHRFDGVPSVPLVSDAGLTVALQGIGAGPEVGRPFHVNASIVGGVGPVEYTWWINGTEVGSGSTPALPALSYTPETAGRVEVDLRTVDQMRDDGNASLNLTVAPSLSASIGAVHPGGDVGRPVLLNLSIGGGVAPYEVNWSTPGGGAAGSTWVGADGPHLLAIAPSAPGPFLLALSVGDAAGAISDGTFELGSVGLGPALALQGPGAPVEAGTSVDLALSVTGGVGPYEWTVEPSVGLANETSGTGRADVGGPMSWSGVPASAGPLEITAFVVDAFGDVAETNWSTDVLPPLTLRSTSSNRSTGSGPTIAVVASIAGGEAPYDLSAAAGGVDVELPNISAAGAYTLTLVGVPTGTEALQVEVEDAAGVERSRNTSVLVAPVSLSPGPSPSPTGVPTSEGSSGSVAGAVGLAAGGLLAAGTVGGLWWWRRRTVRGPPTSSTSTAARALSVVRRALADGEGMDPETLGLVGAEEGIEPPAVTAAVTQWERLGRVRREPEADGNELLFWVPSAPPEPSTDLAGGRP